MHPINSGLIEESAERGSAAVNAGACFSAFNPAFPALSPAILTLVPGKRTLSTRATSVNDHLPISDWAFVVKILGFTAGTIISILLVRLVGHAVSQRGLRQPHGLVAVTILAWNLFGLASTALLLLPEGMGKTQCLMQAISFSGGAILPFSVINVWLHVPNIPADRRRLGRIWAGISLALGLALTAGLLFFAVDYGHHRLEKLFKLMPVNAAILMSVGAWILLKGQRRPQGVTPGVTALLAGVYIPAGICVLHMLRALPHDLDEKLLSLCEQTGLLALVGLLFFFSNFRFADVFIRRSLGVIAALLVALAVVWLIPILQTQTPFPDHPMVAWQIALGLLIGSVLMAAPVARHLIKRCVHSWFFHQPDYRAVLRQIMHEFEKVTSAEELFAKVESHVSSALGLAAVRVVERSRLGTLKELEYTEFFELPEGHPARLVLAPDEAMLLLPIRSIGQVSHVLAIDTGCCRRHLLSEEATFLRRLAAEAGARLDAQERERERINIEAGQERLIRQVTEAELRALRAQVNPHFLFNSLNTIAALIPTDPEGAETMTVRLAKVFRHVLASSERQLASLEEEMRFVQTYLSIEQARFGDRLRVRLEFDPRLAAEPVPSLLLQPVVENALKHGLAPKPGVVNLAVLARKHGNFLCLEVEDDGVGPGAAEDKPESNGLGLRNLTSRLSNLYGQSASLRLEPGAKSGSRVTILIPAFKAA